MCTTCFVRARRLRGSYGWGRISGSRRRSSTWAGGRPCVATDLKPSSSATHSTPNFAWQMRVAFASMVSKSLASARRGSSRVLAVRGWYRRPRAAMAFRRRCCLLGAALIVTGRLRWRGAACSFAARQRPCIRAQAIEFASIAFRKGLARSNEGCVPNVLPLRTGSAARRFWHKCAYCEPKSQVVSGQSGGPTPIRLTVGKLLRSESKVMKFHSLYRLDLG